MTPLHYVQSPKVAELLLRGKGDPNRLDTMLEEHGYTPLEPAKVRELLRVAGGFSSKDLP